MVIEQRRYKRFELKLPVELVRSGANRVARFGETTNLSSAGVLFTSDYEMFVGDIVEYFIHFPSDNGRGNSVRVHCLGKVVRVGLSSASHREPLYSIAATLERHEFVRANTA